ncbi:hypothetical protein VTH82DRAFT_5910 [Thermothelomyces myriococcoides]
MVSVKTFFFAALAAAVSAAPSRPPRHNAHYTLPSVGGGARDLTPPAPHLVLKKIALGHGIQNYTCGPATDYGSSNSTAATALGAVAVLYDLTPFYPGTKGTGLPQDVWDSLPSKVLWDRPLPLNRRQGTQFGADPDQPFPNPPEDLRLPGTTTTTSSSSSSSYGHSYGDSCGGGGGGGGSSSDTAKFLGHHYFDAEGVPVFDLSAGAGTGTGPTALRAAVAKTESVPAPESADRGIMNTGAVAWLRLDDNGLGYSQEVAVVYRVLTAGGGPQVCSVTGEGVHSVPYATYYWFYG